MIFKTIRLANRFDALSNKDTMEDLIIPLIIGIVLILNFRKASKNRKKIQAAKKGVKTASIKETNKEVKSTKPQGIFAKINQVLEEYAETIEKKSAEDSSAEDWPPKKKAETESSDSQSESEEEIDSVWPPRQKELVLEKQELIEKVSRKADDPKQIKKRYQVDKNIISKPTESPKHNVKQKISTQELRNAIVWSEILAPPVSLKEE